MEPVWIASWVVGAYLAGVVLFLVFMHSWLALDSLRSPMSRPFRAVLSEIYWASLSEWTIPLAYVLWPHWWRRRPRGRPDASPQGSLESPPDAAPSVSHGLDDSDPGTTLFSIGPLPIVLVHGWGQNRADFWCLAWRLRRRTGHPLYAFDYWFFGSVERSAARLGRVVDRALADHGTPRVHLVCHSLGGLVARTFVETRAGSARVASVTFIGSPLAGTRRAMPSIGLASKQMVPHSPFLRTLGDPIPPDGVTYHSVWSHSDGLVVPPQSASLKGRGPELVLCDTGHLGLLFRADVANQVVAWLKAAEGRDKM